MTKNDTKRTKKLNVKRKFLHPNSTPRNEKTDRVIIATTIILRRVCHMEQKMLWAFLLMSPISAPVVVECVRAYVDGISRVL